MTAEVSRTAINLLDSIGVLPSLAVARVQCCPNGCERFAISTTVDEGRAWARDTERFEQRFHRHRS